VDVMGDLEWCARRFAGRCSEVFMSHVLEHYRSPGKGWRTSSDAVPGALSAAARMLRPGGVLRLAVPDFGALAKLYAEGKVPLYPKLLGRLCGEQNYVENLHRCAFDHEFLEHCLKQAGFTEITIWNPRELGFERDASFDEIDGVTTSLNLAARKQVQGAS
jgi:predicted SAM-dependent methyltransferase